MKLIVVVVVTSQTTVADVAHSSSYQAQEMDRLEEILSGLSHLDLAGEIVDKEPHASGLGGSCDIYTARSRKHGKKVAVKQVRAFLRKDLSLAKVCLHKPLGTEELKHLSFVRISDSRKKFAFGQNSITKMFFLYLATSRRATIRCRPSSRSGWNVGRFTI